MTLDTLLAARAQLIDEATRIAAALASLDALIAALDGQPPAKRKTSKARPKWTPAMRKAAAARMRARWAAKKK